MYSAHDARPSLFRRLMLRIGLILSIGAYPMSPALWAAFAGATAVLMLIPGPNVALIVANSVSAGLLTVAGTSAAMVAQLTVASLGVTAIFGALAEAFGTLRWLGVAYLVWLGIRAWREPASDLSETRAAPPSKN